MRRLRAPSPQRRVLPETNQEPVMGDVVQLRDYKRREENEAALVRLAKEVMGLIEDTAPCEMPPVQPYFAPESDGA